MRRDPEGRRRRIVEAAVRVIAEVGVGETTHRRIAAEADVPLGSTTYYFPTLDDLIREALVSASQDFRQELARWQTALRGSDEVATVVLDLLERYLADRPRALLEYELYLAAARSTELRPLAGLWVDGLRELLEPLVGPATAGVAALIDGALLQSLVTGEPLDRAGLGVALRRVTDG
jgi:DNA-binding transcriptional regulator YbjK